MSNVGPLFERGLQEAGIRLPTTADAIWVVTRYHMHRIARGDVPPREGARRLIEEVYHRANLYSMSKKCMGDSHGLETLIGNFYSYDDLEERPAEVSCDGLYGEEAKEALGEHIVNDAREWLGRYGV